MDEDEGVTAPVVEAVLEGVPADQVKVALWKPMASRSARGAVNSSAGKSPSAVLGAL